MRNFSEENINNMVIKPHNIVFAWTSEPDYEMNRIMVLNNIEGLDKWDEYLVLEGGHCSCYDFDETSWCGTVYTKQELLAIANAEYNKNNTFWDMVSSYL
jgi:hypothetical protein